MKAARLEIGAEAKPGVSASHHARQEALHVESLWLVSCNALHGTKSLLGTCALTLTLRGLKHKHRS